MKKKILITGANGFIGKNLKETFEKLTESYETACPARKELDLLNTEAVEAYLKNHRFDIVIHAANTNDFKNQCVTKYDALDGNLRMFFNLERCRKLYGRMYYFGSGMEYDSEHYVPEMEEAYFGLHVPKQPYGFSKYVMSKACGQAGNIYDLRLFGVYGKYEEWERRFISNAICRALMGMDITIQKNVYFDYLWVEDLCRILLWFVEHEPVHKHYNVCRGIKTDLYSLGCMVRQILDIDCKILVAKPGWKPEYTGNSARLMDEMGGFAFTEHREAVAQLCEYYKANIAQIDKTKLDR